MGFKRFVKWVQDTFQVESGILPLYIDRPRPPVPDWVMIDDPRKVVRILPSDELLVEPDGPPPRPTPKGLDDWSIDVLAYYIPYHFSRNRWGIYISTSGIAHLSAKLKGAGISPSDDSVIKLAFGTLFEHEVFHFFAETASARMEFATKNPLYLGYFYSPNARLLEEALANAHAYRAIVRGATASFGGSLSAFMKASPPGYRDFDRWLRSGQFQRGRRDAVAHMMEPIHKPISIPSPWPTEFLFGRLGRSLVPTRLVIDVDFPWLRVAKKYPKYKGIQVKTHSNDHPPPHIHIEIPPGQPRTRYTWPGLKPLNGHPPLSGDEEKILAEYLRKHGDKIHHRLESTYGSLPAATV